MQEDQFAALLGHGLPQPLQVLETGIVGGADTRQVERDPATVSPSQEEDGASHQVGTLHREMSTGPDRPASLVDHLREGDPTLTGTPLGSGDPPLLQTSSDGSGPPLCGKDGRSVGGGGRRHDDPVGLGGGSAGNATSGTGAVAGCPCSSR